MMSALVRGCACGVSPKTRPKVFWRCARDWVNSYGTVCTVPMVLSQHSPLTTFSFADYNCRLQDGLRMTMVVIVRQQTADCRSHNHNLSFICPIYLSLVPCSVCNVVFNWQPPHRLALWLIYLKSLFHFIISRYINTTQQHTRWR